MLFHNLEPRLHYTKRYHHYSEDMSVRTYNLYLYTYVTREFMHVW